ncbi:hypothetical protein KDK82_2318 [Delftia sp. K82]|nr:hypothetical protein KDK82_2318 [Delftia sp. K82]
MSTQEDSGTHSQGEVRVLVKAMRLEQRIGVCVERNNWRRCFTIPIVGGVLPAEYQGDAQIEAAYIQVRDHYDKLQRRVFFPSSGDRAPD